MTYPMNVLGEQLGIPPVGDPPNYYGVLGIAPAEATEERVRTAVQELSSLIRQDQHAFPKESQALLNALVAAKLCLLDPARRERHDAGLGSLVAAAASVVAPARRAGAKLQDASVVAGGADDLNAASWLIPSDLPSNDSARIDAEWLVGSGSECQIRVRARSVSRRHCLLKREAGETIVTDLGSKNGTYLNEIRLDEPTPVEDEDIVSLGRRVWLPWPLPPHDESRDLRVFSIGRSPHNDLVIEDPSVSHHHAQLVLEGPTATLYDLRSLNGTRVGGIGEPVGRVEVLDHLPFFFGRAKRYGSQLLDACRER